MKSNEAAFIEALRLRADSTGGWSGPSFGHALPPGVSITDGVSVRTRLLEPGGTLRARRPAADLMLFHHAGGPVEVRLSDPVTGSSPVLVGDAASNGAVPQLVVPAGTRHTVVALSGHGAPLWSEAVVPSRADDAPLPLPDTPAGGLAAIPRTHGLATGLLLRTRLGLTPHVEGGYYRQTYQTTRTLPTPRGERYVANSILYLLDEESPIGFLHSNTSDITHFVHGPGPIRYRMLAPDGSLHEETLGTDVAVGERPVITCPAGWWKSSALDDAVDAGLISELVAPGFDFADQELLTAENLAASYPHVLDELGAYVRSR
ncbi:cupin domain-containing protein [Streptomyces sp. NPDC002018]|uniref:cupin domain-containing protein n=1 Tax=Streptomyces sp. NPDC002018 TaxID=3364629 RepID=UPI0036C1208B